MMEGKNRHGVIIGAQYKIENVKMIMIHITNIHNQYGTQT